MATITLICTLAIKAALQEIVLPGFEHDVAATFDPTAVLATRIARGERFDVIVGTEEFLNELVRNGKITTPVALAVSGIGLAVLPDAARPSIDTPTALKQTLLQARSVAYSRTGASGIYFASLLQRLGIAAEVNGRATVLPKGFTAEALVDGRADIAVQQTSELLSVCGVEMLGELPCEVQQRTRFDAAQAVSSMQPEQAAALLLHLQSPQAKAAYQRYGLIV